MSTRGLGRMHGHVAGVEGGRYYATSTATHWVTVDYDPARTVRPFALVLQPRGMDASHRTAVRTFGTLYRALKAAGVK